MNSVKNKLANAFCNPAIFLLSIYAHACALLDFRVPDYVRDIDARAQLVDPNVDFEKTLTAQIGNSGINIELETPPIFVVGEWGSGKTFQLLSYRNKAAKAGKIIGYCSFWGIQSVKEGLLHTIPAVQRFYVFLCGVLSLVLLNLISPKVFAIALSAPQVSKYIMPGILVFLLSLVLIPSKWKIVYTVMAALSVPIAGVRRIILDDLERSGLDNKEQWRLLLSLWKFNVQYIVPVGHGISTSTYEWRSVVSKLNGRTVHLPTPSSVKLTLINGDLSPGPFIKGDGWIEQLTPRDIISIVDQWYDLIDDQSGFIKWSIGLKLTLDKLMDKSGLSPEDRRRILFHDRGPLGGLKVVANANAFDNVRKGRIDSTLNAVIAGLETNFHAEFKKYTSSHKQFQYNLLCASPDEIAKTDLSV